ncbi:BREX-2 system phosphatase PglZ [Embleya sp. NBC_00888]|uniref:BREX-2 system phosphatase PglZ n=1 Tax=Embleya sp. NBC_00888 TaxID=2975960 RepID=UPI003862F5C4|nr:BREX-2 system phosphatase PglZ [Embleya sp. NBC_00888]
MPTSGPDLNRRIVAGLLATYLSKAKDRRLFLVHGRYPAAEPAEFSLPTSDGKRRGVRVAHAGSVLAITDAWQAHQAQDADLLVVTTDVSDEQVGLDLLGQMVGSRTITVDRPDIVKQRFGATDLDPRMYREQWQWLLDALIEAEPADNWPQRGAVLTLDAAVRALVGVRLSLESVVNGGSVDMDALLGWSRTELGPQQFAALAPDERAGITAWLAEAAGEAAPLLLRLVESGRGSDATALGVLASVLSDKEATAETAVALGSLFGGVGLRTSELRAYTRAVEGVLARWIGDAAAPGGAGESARARVLNVVDRADELAASAHLLPALAKNPLLPSGFRARLHRLAQGLVDGHEAAQAALHDLCEHQLAAHFFPERVRLAEMAVRLARWTATAETNVVSVEQAVHAHAADWGWVDRALAQLWVGDATDDPILDQAYRNVHDAARARRARLDEEFAAVLAPWARHACSTSSAGALLIEDVLRKVVVPLAKRRYPLILVLDGMSSAVAAQLGEELTTTGRWVELAPVAGRRTAAVAMMPSVTTISRAALLCGRPMNGGQSVEKDGFSSFWRQQEHKEAQLFHKGDIPGPAGHRLDAQLVAAIAAEEVVGVVLNTIDESLDHGQQSSVADWTVDSIKYLPELLNAARGQGRPVVLVSDHGHVLDRTPRDAGPTAATGVESARWRTGTAAPGEVALNGPRVSDGGIVAAWSEDIRYTPRKAGHHGGASLAELTVPVLVLAPTAELAPAGWSVLPRESTQPTWWEEPGAAPAAAIVAPPKATKPKAQAQPALATTTSGSATSVPTSEPTPSAGATLGKQVVATKIYESQRVYVRKSPDRKVVAAVIDALDAAGGTLSLAAVGAAVIASGGRAQTRSEGFVTMLTRLLNVEGYDVISLIDARTRVQLNRTTLREQFELPKATE